MNLTQARAVWIPRKGLKRIGHGVGSGHGKTSTKGNKGAKSRSGYSRRPYFAGGQMPIIRRIPKRGFHNPWGADFAIVNCGDLNRFEDGDRVDVERLIASGLVNHVGSGIKVLATGDVSKRLIVKVHRISTAAKAKIEKAGGQVEVLDKVTARPPKRPPTQKGPAPAAAKPSAEKGPAPAKTPAEKPPAPAAKPPAVPRPPKTEKKQEDKA
jgi:large subunit ribosomal protein L15